MAIKNINEIRSTDYVKNDQQFVSDTLDALANAGQRFGIPGDGLTKGTLSLQDIFPNIKINNVVEEISYSYLQCDILFSVDKNDSNKPFAYISLTNVYKENVIDNVQVWKINPILDIYTIKPSEYINVLDDIYYNIQYGNNIDDVFNKRYYNYTSIGDISLNILYTKSNFSYIYNVNKSNTISNVSNCIDNDDYVISKITINNITNNIKDCTDYLTLIGITDDSYLKYKLNDTNSYFKFKHESTSNTIIIPEEYKGEFDNVKLGKTELEYILTKVYYDQNLLDNVKSYHSTKISENLSFSMFNDFVLRLATECKNERLDNDNHFTCYFSSNYEFPIVRSVNNKELIYCTDDITVEYCKGNIEKTINEHILDNSKYTEVNKYVLVDWRNDKTELNNKEDAYDKYGIFNIINNIDNESNVDLFYPSKVINTLTMPYLTEDNYWNINGYQTNVKATGKEAVQPSTIIIQQFKDDTYPNIVSYLYNEKLNDINKQYIVSKSVKISLPTTEDNLQGQFSIIDTPVLNIENIKNNVELEAFVKTSMIMSIKQLDDTKEVLEQSKNSDIKLEQLIPGGFIMTFWVYDETINDFKCICYNNGNDSIAIDIGKLANLNHIIKNSLNNINEEPDRFYHSQLVFDTINKELKQVQQHRKKDVLYNATDNTHATLNNADIYPLIYNTLSYIRNNQSESFAQGLFPIKTITEEYKNDTILNVGFYNKIEMELSNNKIIDLSMGLTNDYKTSFMSEGNNDKTPVGRQGYYDTINANTTGISVQYTYDYIPNGIYNNTDGNTTYSYTALYTPILDLSSVLINNNNFINRLGILSFDKPENEHSFTYYSYIGTAYNINDNKSHFILGTSTRNVNVNRHVIDPSRTNNFKEQKHIDINFENFNLNAINAFNNAKFNYVNGDTLVYVKNHDGITNTYSTTIDIIFEKNTIANNSIEFDNNVNCIGYIKKTAFNTTPYISNFEQNTYITYIISLNRCISKYFDDMTIKDNAFENYVEVEKDVFDLKSQYKILPIHILYKIDEQINGITKPCIIGANLTSDIY